jgi:hypothetical protein
LGVVLTSGCSDTPAGAVITYGAVLDRTGSISMTSWFDAAALATAHANAGLTMAGQSLQFNLATSDSINTPTVTVTRATDLVRTVGAKAIITDSSQDDIALNATYYNADASDDLNVPIIGMTCTAPTINDPTAVNATDPVNQATLRNSLKWNFRTVMNSDLQATVITRIAFSRGQSGDVNGDGKFKIGFYGTTSAGAGTGFAAGIQSALNALQLPTPPILEAVYSPATLDANTYDFASDLAKLTDNKNEATGQVDGYPDVIMIITFPQYNAAIVKSYINGGYMVPLLQTHTARFYSTLRAAGSVFEGQEGTSPTVLDNGASGDVFASTYKAATGASPQYLDSNTYDSAMLIMLAAAITTYATPVYFWSDISWWLSILAFFGILVIAPQISQRLFRDRPVPALAGVAIETFCAELMTIPLVMFIFGQVSLVGLLANVLVALFIPLAMLLSTIAAIAGMAMPLFAGWFAWPAKLLLTYMLDTAEVLSRIPHIFQTNVYLGVGDMVLCYGVVAFCLLAVYRRKIPWYEKLS